MTVLDGTCFRPSHARLEIFHPYQNTKKKFLSPENRQKQAPSSTVKSRASVAVTVVTVVTLRNPPAPRPTVCATRRVIISRQSCQISGSLLPALADTLLGGSYVQTHLEYCRDDPHRACCWAWLGRPRRGHYQDRLHRSALGPLRRGRPAIASAGTVRRRLHQREGRRARTEIRAGGLRQQVAAFRGADRTQVDYRPADAICVSDCRLQHR